mmetsp:Transcript_21495/g.54114  ORF Transcript_21495/g.54114 Transcript_21495/m.54114 type:complete len:354 (-) Transcript_21495:555-1616(-)
MPLVFSVVHSPFSKIAPHLSLASARARFADCVSGSFFAGSSAPAGFGLGDGLAASAESTGVGFAAEPSGFVAAAAFPFAPPPTRTAASALPRKYSPRANQHSSTTQTLCSRSGNFSQNPRTHENPSAQFATAHSGSVMRGMGVCTFVSVEDGASIAWSAGFLPSFCSSRSSFASLIRSEISPFFSPAAGFAAGGFAAGGVAAAGGVLAAGAPVAAGVSAAGAAFAAGVSAAGAAFAAGASAAGAGPLSGSAGVVSLAAVFFPFCPSPAALFRSLSKYKVFASTRSFSTGRKFTGSSFICSSVVFFSSGAPPIDSKTGTHACTGFCILKYLWTSSPFFRTDSILASNTSPSTSL